ncbi:MAG: hypothetical protein IIA61_14665 [Candidatus Marinimicrobia bacterium]|nr:hypothetical protein [Candidatus Neomarinimicrobiota bacterium]
MTFQKDIAEVFSDTVEVDETYLGSQGKTKDKAQKRVVVNVEEELLQRILLTKHQYLVFYALLNAYPLYTTL